jgi:hypothetical protein
MCAFEIKKDINPFDNDLQAFVMKHDCGVDMIVQIAVIFSGFVGEYHLNSGYQNSACFKQST